MRAVPPNLLNPLVMGLHTVTHFTTIVLVYIIDKLLATEAIKNSYWYIKHLVLAAMQ